MYRRKITNNIGKIIYAGLASTVIFGCVYLAISAVSVTSYYGQFDDDKTATVLNSAWERVWCDIKSWFGFSCPSTVTTEYAIIDSIAGTKEDTTLNNTNTLPPESVSPSQPPINPPQSSVVPASEIIREVTIRENTVDTSRFITREEYDNQIDAVMRSIENSSNRSVAQSGGGGGGADYLEDLIDVVPVTKTAGDLLIWNGVEWTNVSTSSLGITGTGAVDSVNGQIGSVTLNTSQIPENTNLYFTNDRARSALSETVAGLDYATSTGVLSLTAGYSIPLSASTTNWTTAYNTVTTNSTNWTTAYNLASTLNSASSTWNNTSALVTASSTFWNQAYSWGNHAIQGYLTSSALNPYLSTTTAAATYYPLSNPAGYISSYTESDPLFSSSSAATITGTDISNWNTAYTLATILNSASSTWNNTSALVSASSSEWFTAYTLANLLNSASSTWNTAYSWGDHSLAGYLTAISTTTVRNMFSNTATGLTYNAGTGETSLTANYHIPLTASTTNWNSAYNTVTANSANWNTAFTLANLLNSASSTWNTAYGWGDHSMAGYLTSMALTSYLSTTTAAATYYPLTNPAGYTNNTGTVSSVGLTVPTGLTVTGSPVTASGTLDISLTGGYVIPLSASTTQWTNTANLVSASSTNWSTAYSWGNHSLAGYLTGVGTTTIVGNVDITGNIIPSANITYDLGSPTRMWKDVYIGPGSLYINGKKVLEDVSNTITLTTDNNQNLAIETKGMGSVGITATSTGSLMLETRSGAIDLLSASGNINIISASGNLNIGTTGSGQLNFGTINQGIWHGTDIDISDYTNLSISATGLQLSGDAIALTSGYFIPLTASSTAWDNASGLVMLLQASSTNWDLAFNWGNHATQGYLTSISTTTVRNMFAAGTGLSYSTTTGTFTNTGVLSIGGLTGAISTSSLGIGSSLFTEVGTTTYLTALSNNLAIGTTTAVTKLTIQQGPFNDQNSALRIANNDNTNSIRIYVASSTLGARLNVGGSDVMSLLHDGRVGIGTTTPSYTLTVSGRQQFERSGASIFFNPNYNTANLSALITTGVGSATSTIDLHLQAGNDDSSSGITIKPSGNIGIGTTSPTSKLHLEGTNDITGGITLYSTVGTEKGRFAIYPQGNLSTVFQSLSSGGLTSFMNSSGIANLVINHSSGNVGIGTSTPISPLHVVGSGTQFRLGTPSTTEAHTTLSDSLTQLNIRKTATSSAFISLDPIVSDGTSIPTVRFFREASSTSASEFQILRGDGTTAINTMLSSRSNSYLNLEGNVGIGTTNANSKLTVSVPALDIDASALGTTTARQMAQTIRVTGGSNVTGRIFSGISLGSQSEEYAGLYAYDDGTNAATGLGFFTGNSTGVMEKMRITATGNVGIGTTSPEAKLHVVGAILALAGANPVAKVAAPYISPAVSSGFSTSSIYSFWFQSGTGMSNPASDSIGFNAGGNERLRITSGGFVGIGTTSPATLLHLAGATARLRIQANNTNGYLDIQHVNAGLSSFTKTSASGQSLMDFNPIPEDGTSTAMMRFFRNSSTTGQVALQIMKGDGTSSVNSWLGGNTNSYLNALIGNLGIGTSSPGAKLHVTGGDVWIGDDASVGRSLFFRRNGVSLGGITSSNNVFSLFGGSSAANHLTINSSGNVGIGTTTPEQLLTLFRSATSAFATIYGPNGVSGQGAGLKLLEVYSIDPAGFDLFLESASNRFDVRSFANSATPVERLSIMRDNGYIGIGTTSPASRLHIVNGSSGQTFTGVGGLIVESDGSANGFFTLQVASAVGKILSVTNAGNVGIGTTSPSSRLQVESGVAIDTIHTIARFGMATSAAPNFQIQAITDGTHNGGNQWLRIYGSGGSQTQMMGSGNWTTNYHWTVGSASGTKALASIYSSGGGSASASQHGALALLSTDDSQIYANTVNNVPAGTVNVQLRANGISFFNGGNVGVGTSTPSSALTVQGTYPGTDFTNSNFAVYDSDGILRTNLFGFGGQRWNMYNTGNEVGSAEIVVANGRPALLFRNASSTGRSQIGQLFGTGGLTFGATSTDSNPGHQMVLTTAGNLGIGTSSAAQRLTVVGDQTTSGYLRVGSNAIPTNTTVGDLTSNRLSVGNGALGEFNGAMANLTGTLTSTSSGARIGTNITLNINPSVTSSADFRSLNMSATVGGDNSITGVGGAVSGGWFEVRMIGSGSINNTNGVRSVGLILGAGTQNFGSVGEASAMYATPLSSFSNTATGLISNARGLRVVNSSVTNQTLTNQVGVSIDPLTAATNNTSLLIGGATVPAGNFGIYNQSTSSNYFASNIGVGTSTPTAQFHTTGTVRFSNFGSGSLQSDAAGNISVSSDINLKDYYGDYNSGLTSIRGLQPIQYHWNEISGLDRTTLYTGFSAQNVKDFIPEAVGRGPDGYLTLSDRPILAAAINAIKELDLSLSAIASSSASSTPFSRQFADDFFTNLFNRLEEWLSSTANGIGTMVASVFQASEMICVDNECLTADDIRELKSQMNYEDDEPTQQVPTILPGCMDEEADNYNPAATEPEEGACTYSDSDPISDFDIDPDPEPENETIVNPEITTP